jgi:hypothetical protein
MEFLNLSVGLLLPWLGGALMLMAVEARVAPQSRPNRLRQAGYGFFLGYALVSVTVTAGNAWFGQVSWAWSMVFLSLVAAAAGALLWLGPERPAARSGRRTQFGTAAKILLPILATWAGLHLLLAAIEVFHLPLYPWDAWLVWVYRAKAWFMAAGMAAVVVPADWVAANAADVFTVDAAAYPRLPSVIPFWAALSLGRWSETLINLPGLMAGIAIGLALYGQCRESGMGLLGSTAAGYLLLSLPLLGTHLALAGYADIWMAGFAGLGFLALIRGAGPGQGFQTTLGFLMLAFAMLVKNEGVVWFLAALLMQALITFRWRTNLVTGLVIAAVLWMAQALGVTHVDIPLIGTLGMVNGQLQIPFIGSFALEIHDIWQPYRDNFFVMGTWNLLWVLVFASLLAGLVGNKPFADPARVASVAFIGIFLATQLFIFGFTDQGIWADTYTAINRLPLHFTPALIFAALTLFHSRSALADGAEIPVKPAGTAVPSLARPLVAALIAAVIVIAGAMVIVARDLPQSPAEIRHYATPDFNFVMGSGSAKGDQVVVSTFTDGYALVSSGSVTIPAADYRFISLTLVRNSDNGVPILFWRHSDAPGELARVPVRESDRGLIDLSVHAGWRGEITEFGFLFQSSDGVVAIGPAALEPDSLARRLQLTWNAWTAFEVWSQKSVNFLQGGRPDQPLRAPALLIAWLALTVALGWLLSKRSGGNSRQLWLVAAMAFWVAWMLLDFRWTVNSLRQASQTLENYRGANEHERLAVGLDGIVYRYISRLKADVLPSTPARILLVADEQAAEYFLQRAKYHLLPHSVHATRQFPPGLEPNSLDSVIFLGAAGGIHEVPGWNPDWEQALRPVDRAELGEAFTVVKDAD